MSFQMSWYVLQLCSLSLFCPVLCFIYLTSFPVPFWELVKNILLSADDHLSRWLFTLMTKAATCWLKLFVSHVGRGTPNQGVLPAGRHLQWLWWQRICIASTKGFSHPAVVGSRNSLSSNFTSDFGFHGYNPWCAVSPLLGFSLPAFHLSS